MTSTQLHYSTTETVLLVIGFNLVMLWLLEVPLVSFVIAPDWTPRAIERAKAWVSRHAQCIRRTRTHAARHTADRQGHHRADMTSPHRRADHALRGGDACWSAIDRRCARQGGLAWGFVDLA
jgi:hypothetical protein